MHQKLLIYSSEEMVEKLYESRDGGDGEPAHSFTLPPHTHSIANANNRNFITNENIMQITLAG